MKAPTGESTSAGAISPVAAFAALTVLVAATATLALVAATNDEKGAPATGPTASWPSTDHRLTHPEAIARFEVLDGLRVKSLEARDLALLRSLYTPDSPALRRGERSIQQLRRNGVVVDEAWKIRDVQVLQIARKTIRLRVVGISDVSFFDDAGRDVTSRSRRERQTVDCVMRFLNGDWLLHDCRIVAARPVEKL